MCYDIKSTMSGEDDDATVTGSVNMMLIKPNPVTIKRFARVVPTWQVKASEDDAGRERSRGNEELVHIAQRAAAFGWC